LVNSYSSSIDIREVNVGDDIIVSEYRVDVDLTRNLDVLDEPIRYLLDSRIASWALCYPDYVLSELEGLPIESICSLDQHKLLLRPVVYFWAALEGAFERLSILVSRVELAEGDIRGTRGC